MAGLEALETVAKAAHWEATAASFVIPTGWSSVAIIYMAQSNPGELWQAADQWWDVAKKLKAARDAVENRVKAFDERAWSGKDRDLFDRKMNDLQNQLFLSYVFAGAVSLILRVMALLISFFILLMAVLATMLLFHAIRILFLRVVAMINAAIPGANVAAAANLGAAEAQGHLFALRMHSQLRSSEQSLLEGPGKACAATLAGLMGVNVLGQMLTGNTNAYGEFIQATVNSADDVLKGRLALLEQKMTGQLMRGRMIGGQGWGKFHLPYARIPSAVRPWVQGGAGIKGLFDVGVPGYDHGKEDGQESLPENLLKGGSPLLNRGGQKIVDEVTE